MDTASHYWLDPGQPLLFPTPAARTHVHSRKDQAVTKLGAVP